jgi:signal peptidase II
VLTTDTNRNHAKERTISTEHPVDGRVVTRTPLIVGVTVALFAFISDQLSKWIILREIGPNASRDSIEIVPGLLWFDFVRNTGSAFGLFQGGSQWIRVLALLAIGILLIYYIRFARRDWLVSLALGLQLGGALGNIVDRFRHGYVVDFIDVPRWPTFNVADSAITVGVVLLVYGLLFRDVDGPTHQADASGRPTMTAVANDES